MSDEELIWIGTSDNDGDGKITGPQKEVVKKLVDLREVISQLDNTELEPPVGKVKIQPDGTAVPLSDDPHEIAKIREFLRQAGVST